MNFYRKIVKAVFPRTHDVINEPYNSFLGFINLIN